ncbi:hypothetical protein CLU83_0098 [Flavobacterium sp. 1]|uniref:hypothetical protein n=1 Tax=Flavobacterium sp. 1 TaxID=2035200 RepID=UPI000C23C8C8|nr:hypothetical protein [Flavobacterium sp. 1]PJJ06972.1 hypothetical protein CLU83_0098 [Flavobacterium sp. 1]
MKNKEAKSIFSSLENFSSTPPSELWDKIEAQLDKPKKKKRLVIWWWAAACLVAGLSLPTIWYVNYNQGNNQELIIGNDANGVVLQNDSKNNRNTNENINKNESAIEKVSLGEKGNHGNEAKNENLNSKEIRISLTNANSVAAKMIPSVSSKVKKSKKFKNSNGINDNQLVAEGSDKSKADVITANKNTKAGTYNTASVVGFSNFSSKNSSNGNAKTIVSSDNDVIPESKQNKESVKNENSKSALINQNPEVSGFNTNKTIAENSSAKDSLNKIKKEVAQLENALAELDKDKTKKKTSSEAIDKWSLQVFAGVMGSENYNNEKALGNTVASKQSNGYGVKTNYKLNKKWAVSSGFKINELGQKIDGVAYYERGPEASFTSGILPSNNVVQDSPSKNNAIVFVSNNENYLFAANSKTSTGFETGNVTQNLKYFEMPLEVSYALLSKKKTSISMNTGGFVGRLISNEVLLNGSSIGENKNVNEFVYGTLLSSTLQYEFYKKTKFFIEPGMNYYINPLENQSFNQFQWMFNVGLNVSF